MVSCCFLVLSACTDNDGYSSLNTDEEWFDIATIESSRVSSTNTTICGTPKTYILCAGQNNSYGSVTVSNDQHNIYVEYESAQTITEVHVWIGKSLLDVPGRKNPAPGRFPYKSVVNGSSYTFTIPYDGSVSQYYIIAHAAFANGETGYASSSCPVTSRIWENWAQYIVYDVQSCTTFPGDEICGTGFGYLAGHATCFLDIPNLNNNRWGWVIGPLGIGTYSDIKVWANAGQCDLGKGQYVADAEVIYDGTNVSFTLWNINPDYNLDESHYNVSHVQRPATTAPGKYNCNTGNCIVTNNGAPIYVIVHTSSTCEGSGGGIDPS